MQEARRDYRPMEISELLDSSFRLYRARFAALVGIQAVQSLLTMLVALGSGLVLVASIVPVLLSVWTHNTDVSQVIERIGTGTGAVVFLLWGLLFAVAAIVIGSVGNGALIYATQRAYMEQADSIVEAMRVGLRRSVALALAGLAVGLLFMFLLGLGLAVSMGLTFVVTQTLPQAILLGLVWLGYVTWISVWLMRFSFVPQAVVLEGAGPMVAIRRSTNLMKGQVWRVSLYLGLLLVVVMVVYMVAAMIGGFFTEILRQGIPSLAVVSIILQAAVNMVVSFAAPPFFVVGWTLLYFDTRVRKEGFDLDLLAQGGRP